MKRLAFCFDGTWNRLDAPYSTNVVITAESVLPLADGNTAQLIYYDEGVGTGRWDRFRGGMFGSGLDQNLADAYRFLIFNYTPGDEIYVFGFSRGAYTARSFVGLISNCGILLRRHAGKVMGAITRYRSRESSSAYVESMMQFRREHSPEVCISEREETWREQHVPGYVADSKRRLEVTFLGVWDTVGALGIPSRFAWLRWFNKRYHFHDTILTSFVRSARHAVAIDERRLDFRPTLWTNVAELNSIAGKDGSDDDAPYQQKWFPGTHSSVGGGGERRGLSDQALDWVLDGARHAGLKLDASDHSRIYELAPDYREFLENSEASDWTYRAMKWLASADREPGPEKLTDVSLAARRRWLERSSNLRDQQQYRPPSLAQVSTLLDSQEPGSLGVGADAETSLAEGQYRLHQVVKGDSLRSLAKTEYGKGSEWTRIFDANRNKLEDPDRIYVGQLLRIPTDSSTPNAPRI